MSLPYFGIEGAGHISDSGGLAPQAPSGIFAPDAFVHHPLQPEGLHSRLDPYFSGRIGRIWILEGSENPADKLQAQALREEYGYPLHEGDGK